MSTSLNLAGILPERRDIGKLFQRKGTARRAATKKEFNHGFRVWHG
jgi:hypothetical protein